MHDIMKDAKFAMMAVVFEEDRSSAMVSHFAFVSASSISEEMVKRIDAHFHVESDEFFKIVESIKVVEVAEVEAAIVKAMKDDACFHDDRIKVVDIDRNKVVEFFESSVIEHGRFM